MNEFGDIIGNRQIVKTLENSVRNNSVSHAYIFAGESGSGKKLLANSFVKFLFCKTKQSNCVCHSCRQFDSNNHSDLVYVRRQEKEKSLGVELVREKIINELNKKPFEYSYKVFIIEEAELLTVGAQNALLRSIEEPPAYAVLIFLSENLSFLPTVLSRCFIYKMQSFGNEFLFNHLKAQGFNEAKSRIASEYAQSIGGAVSLYENDVFFEMREQINDSLAILSGNSSDLAAFYDKAVSLEQYKDKAAVLTGLMLMWFRDVLAYKATNDAAFIRQKDYREQIGRCAGLLTFESVYKKVDGLLDFAGMLAANTQFQAALDALAIRITQ